MTINVTQTSPYSGTPHQENAAGTAMSNPTALGAITQGDLVIGGGYNTGVNASFTPGGSYTADVNFHGTNAIGGITIQSKLAGASESTTLTTTSSVSGTWVFSALEASGISSATPAVAAATAETTSNATSITVTSPSIPANTYVDVLAVLEVLCSTSPTGGDVTNLTGWTVVYSALEGIALAYKIVSAPSGTISVSPQFGGGALLSQAGLVIYPGLLVPNYAGELWVP